MMLRRQLLACSLVVAAMFAATLAAASAGRFLTTEEFLNEAFERNDFAAETLMVDSDLRVSIEGMLERRFPRLRVRYWSGEGKTAWIFEETGRTEPITLGVSVHNGRVGIVRVLEYRESRGYEIRFPYFTEQFRGVGLTPDHRVDGRIDGISGATLSVHAVDRAVRLALVLDGFVKTRKLRISQATH
jgi:hypothetical protein